MPALCDEGEEELVNSDIAMSKIRAPQLFEIPNFSGKINAL